uniref:Uncharacterized protein n=1 Tax=Laticauda laticaudata TaxID=8630 RepID=A0A8C5RFR2_LATLA
MNLNCWKCKKKHGTFFHMWWSCTEVQRFWCRVKKWLEKIMAEIPQPAELNHLLLINILINYNKINDLSHSCHHVSINARFLILMLVRDGEWYLFS